MQLAVNDELNVKQLDIKTAYLNADVGFEIYIEHQKGTQEGLYLLQFMSDLDVNTGMRIVRQIADFRQLDIENGYFCESC